MTGYVAVKNFGKFQHYRDRNPPWIKLHAHLLNDYDFGRLQDASKLHLVMIWLLASRLDNRVPADPDWIARKIGATSPVDLQALVDAGFLLSDQPLRALAGDASKTLSTSTQDARPEREAEAETQGSDAVASGAAAPTDPAKLIFDSGRQLLARTGLSSRQAGSLIGRWRKDFRDADVIAAIGAAVREDAQEPIEFVAACLRNANGKRPRNDAQSRRDAALDAFGELAREYRNGREPGGGGLGRAAHGEPGSASGSPGEPAADGAVPGAGHR